MFFETLAVSTAAVTIGEIGDKTQLLALMLAARFRRPAPIVLGILVATILNHALAGAVGAWLAAFFSPQTLRWVLGASFLGMAAWMLIPDELEEDEVKLPNGLGAFGATALAFFLAEMGDKTQLATVALAARFDSLTAVVCGTTLGMLIADVPAVFVGNRMAERLPLRAIRIAAAALFALLGVLALAGPSIGL